MLQLAQPEIPSPDEYYQESGIFPWYAPCLMFLAGFVAAILVAPLICAFSGFFLLAGVFGLTLIAAGGLILLTGSFIMPLLHGFAIFYAVLITANACGVRNNRIVKLMALLAILCGMYFFAHSLLWLLAGADWEQFFPLLHPLRFTQEVMAQLAGRDLIINAAGLTLAGIYFFLYLLVLRFIPDDAFLPFCEACGRLYKEQPHRLAVSHKNFLEWRRTGFTVFKQEELDKCPAAHLKACLYFCKSCQATNYLRVWEIRYTPKAKDSDEFEEDPRLLYDLLRVPYETKAVFNAAATESPSLEQ